MKWFFFDRETLVKGLLITLVVLNFFNWVIVLLWFLALVGALILLRRNKVNYRDNFSTDPHIVFAPLDGKVVSAQNSEGNREHAQIQLKMRTLGPYGLYLPFDCSVEKLRETKRKKRGWFLSPRGYSLSLVGKNGDRLTMELPGDKLWFSPRLYARGGDKGLALACFGFFPMGRVIIKFPPGSKATVSAGESIKAGITPIGTLP